MKLLIWNLATFNALYAQMWQKKGKCVSWWEMSSLRYYLWKWLNIFFLRIMHTKMMQWICQVAFGQLALDNIRLRNCCEAAGNTTRSDCTTAGSWFGRGKRSVNVILPQISGAENRENIGNCWDRKRMIIPFLSPFYQFAILFDWMSQGYDSATG